MAPNASHLPSSFYCISSPEPRPSQCIGIGERASTLQQLSLTLNWTLSSPNNKSQLRGAGGASTEGRVEGNKRTRLRRQGRDTHGEGVRLVPAEHLAAAGGHADEAPVLLHVPALDEQHLLAQVHHGARPALHDVSRSRQRVCPTRWF